MQWQAGRWNVLRMDSEGVGLVAGTGTRNRKMLGIGAREAKKTGTWSCVMENWNCARRLGLQGSGEETLVKVF